MKNVKHITRKCQNGNVLLMSAYKNASKKFMRKMIDRLWEQNGRPVLLKTRTSVFMPEVGIEIIRTNYREAVVCRLLGIEKGQCPSAETLIEKGVTHFYNGFTDSWIPLEDIIEESKREDAMYHQEINSPEI